MEKNIIIIEIIVGAISTILLGIGIKTLKDDYNCFNNLSDDEGS